MVLQLKQVIVLQMKYDDILVLLHHWCRRRRRRRRRRRFSCPFHVLIFYHWNYNYFLDNHHHYLYCVYMDYVYRCQHWATTTMTMTSTMVVNQMLMMLLDKFVNVSIPLMNCMYGRDYATPILIQAMIFRRIKDDDDMDDKYFPGLVFETMPCH